MFKKVLVANRGEIALRIIKTLKRLGIASVAVYSDADAEALHVLHADEAVRIGPPLSRKSYLDGEKIISVALSTGAEAIHPGYGFLSENADFAASCARAGLTFIGPSPDAIDLAGDKANARAAMAEAGIPVIPGSDGELSDETAAAKAANTLGYPVILKASAGGGGRGMRIANDETELTDAFKTASGEAAAAFGNGGLYLEKYLRKPRHIEVQLLADSQGTVVHLGERECSLQIRHQKLIEESPSPFVDGELREKLGEAATGGARAIGYENAGTVEFLVDSERNFYFMELNSRIQVEHPVTEFVTGLDLVEEQLKIASGEKLSFTQEEITFKGWAIECRINATDPDNGFMPSPGEVDSLTLPSGENIRVDTLLYEKMTVVPFYDSLVAKIVSWGEKRDEAIEEMLRALEIAEVGGIATTMEFCRKIICGEPFRSGTYDTNFLEDN